MNRRNFLKFIPGIAALPFVAKLPANEIVDVPGRVTRRAGSEFTAFSGFDHLEGETIKVLDWRKQYLEGLNSHFVNQYEAEVYRVFERRGSLLRGAIRQRDAIRQ